MAKATKKKKSTSKRSGGANKPGHRKSARKSRRDSFDPEESLWWRLVRYGVALGIWLFIAVGTMMAWYAAELPKITEAPQLIYKNAVTVRGRDNSVLARYGDLKGVSTPVSALPAHLIYAVLATEDRRFYQHFGIDPVGIARAMVTNITKGRVAQGGSTITQQLAKNLFLSPERTFKRKVQEAMLAVWIERHLSKDEILSAYLNRVYMGSGTYGVEAAAEVYYNKSAKDLNLREAATIAGLLKAPSRYSPQANPAQAAERANVVLAAMADAGYITPEEAKSLTSLPPAPRKKPEAANAIRYFTDWVTRDLKGLIGEPQMDVFVTTTIDPEIQNAAEKALAAQLRAQGSEHKVTQGAMVVLDYDGAVLAMVGGYDYQRSQFNRATDARRQPGSSFKPFVYLAALREGWKPSDSILDAPIIEGKYRPGNYDGEYYGEMPLRYALAYSQNTAAVRLAQYVGVPKIIETARAAGVRAPMHPDLSLALGTAEVPMIEMANAYATLARGGLYLDPYAITRITDKRGRLLYQRSNAVPARRVFDPRTVEDLKDMMELVVREGTGRAAQGPYYAAGKTGTSQEFRDAWFIGFTDRYTAAVWVGNDDNSSMKKITGGNIPARIFRETMTVAHAKRRAGGTFDVSENGFNGAAVTPADQRRMQQGDSSQFDNFLRGFIGGRTQPLPRPAPSSSSHENADRYN